MDSFWARSMCAEARSQMAEPFFFFFSFFAGALEASAMSANFWLSSQRVGINAAGNRLCTAYKSSNSEFWLFSQQELDAQAAEKKDLQVVSTAEIRKLKVHFADCM